SDWRGLWLLSSAQGCRAYRPIRSGIAQNRPAVHPRGSSRCKGVRSNQRLSAFCGWGPIGPVLAQTPADRRPTSAPPLAVDITPVCADVVSIGTCRFSPLVSPINKDACSSDTGCFRQVRLSFERAVQTILATKRALLRRTDWRPGEVAGARSFTVAVHC